MTTVIPSVTTNTEKYLSYKEHMTRLNKARAGGFYLEAIFILYAMMEDRLSAFLYYAGVTNKTREKVTSTKKVRPHLNQTFSTQGANLRMISKKMGLIKTMIAWSDGYTPVDKSRDYLDVLCRQVQSTAHRDEIIGTLEGIEAWCKRRNQLVHALLSKKVENQEELLIELVETGLQHNRKLDSFICSFKVRNNIRGQFNIQ